MSNGTVRWFNRTVGAGFIRTDDGENVMFGTATARGVGHQDVAEHQRRI